MPETVVIGEVGLAGEVRSISQALLRINEAEKLGFKHCVLPRNNLKGLDYRNKSLHLIPVSTVKETLDILLGGTK
jgi:DNA repair protein RadA/Sms